MARTIRSNALEKLARLSAQSSTADGTKSDFARLFKRCPPGLDVRADAFKLQEVEAILALCQSAPFIESPLVAEKLLTRLSPYLAVSYAQTFSPSPSFRTLEPSPYEVLTHNLTSAVISLGLRHSQLRSQATTALEAYIQGWATAAADLSTEQFEHDETLEYTADSELARVMTHSLSLLGFLGAAAEHVRFWNAYDRLQFVQHVRTALTEDFLVVFETALSIVRNARSQHYGLREWKRFAKHHAATGRPLGAMILHDSLLKVVLASASLLVGTRERLTSPASVLDHLQTSLDSGNHQNPPDASESSLIEGLSRMAVGEMERLENDLDYLQRVGSAWQQQQASSVKAKVLVTYLCCFVCDKDEHSTDADMLTAWLDTVLNDPAQSADHELASTVLKSMAILAKLSPRLASSLGRSLPQIIVQANFDHRTTSIAAASLAAVLSLLPQDAIITTLYSLGNVISVATVPDRNPPASPAVHGSPKPARTDGVYNNQNGSAVSLTPSDVDEPRHVHTTVVETIVSVARNCKDPKITALALSMLIQKIGRSGKVVDAKIITDSAYLGIHSPTAEFRTLLKVYTRLSHEALVSEDTAKLEAVCSSPRSRR